MAESVKSIIQGFLITLEKERGYSKLTIKAYRNDLNRFYDFLRNYHGQDNLDLGSIDRQTIRHFLGMEYDKGCLLYTSPSPRDGLLSRMPSSA